MLPNFLKESVSVFENNCANQNRDDSKEDDFVIIFLDEFLKCMISSPREIEVVFANIAEDGFGDKRRSTGGGEFAADFGGGGGDEGGGAEGGGSPATARGRRAGR